MVGFFFFLLNSLTFVIYHLFTSLFLILCSEAISQDFASCEKIRFFYREIWSLSLKKVFV